MGKLCASEKSGLKFHFWLLIEFQIFNYISGFQSHVLLSIKYLTLRDISIRSTLERGLQKSYLLEKSYNATKYAEEKPLFEFINEEKEIINFNSDDTKTFNLKLVSNFNTKRFFTF